MSTQIESLREAAKEAQLEGVAWYSAKDIQAGLSADREAAYIAAASPDYVLKLLEVVDKARAYLEADGHANWMQSAALSAAIAALKE